MESNTNPPEPQAPQQPEAAPIPQKSSNGIVWGVIVLIVLAGASAAYVMKSRADKEKQDKLALTGLSQLKQMGTGLIIYTADYDDMYPLAGDWMTVLEPYVKNESLYHSPALKETGGEYGIAFRKEQVAASPTALDAPSDTAILFDSTVTGRSALGDLTTLPKPGRYDGKNMISFADSSAKAIDANDSAAMANVK